MSSEWRADIPIYRQIVDKLLEGILDGTYDEGSLLPSVRQIAEIFDVSAITGAKVVQVSGNIAPQSPGTSAMQGTFSASDVLVIVIYEPAD